MDARGGRRTGAALRWRRILAAVALTTVALVLAGLVDVAADRSSARTTTAGGTASGDTPSSSGADAAGPASVPDVANPSLPAPRTSHAAPQPAVADPPATTTGRQRTTRACRYIPFGQSARRVDAPPRRPVHATRLVLRTRLGSSQLVHTVVIALAPGNAPCAVNSVDHLARAGFYDRTSCPRLTTRFLFVLQCGDPSGTGAGGPGYRFRAELTGRETYPAGTVAMALGTPNTTGSQFFVVYRTAKLNPKFPIIGHVVRGLAVVAADAAHGVHRTYSRGDGRPVLPVHIVSAAAGCAPPSGTRGAALRVAQCPVRTLPQ